LNKPWIEIVDPREWVRTKLTLEESKGGESMRGFEEALSMRSHLVSRDFLNRVSAAGD
jgi:hypothetical protein